MQMHQPHAIVGLGIHGTDTISPTYHPICMGYTWLADWEGGCAGQAFVGWLYLEGSTCDLSPTYHPLWMGFTWLMARGGYGVPGTGHSLHDEGMHLVSAP